MTADSLQRKVWASLAITIVFIATVFLVGVPASRFTDPAVREYAAGVARVILALLVILTIRQRNRGSYALTSPSPRSWAIVLPVALYSLIVYPLLFTGSLGLNLSQPNLAAGVAFNGFAAGALEEFVFRGLILSLLLSGNPDEPGNAWNAILISALLFSLPHALNLFAGHAEARVLAQLVWSFLLGVVFACLRISGRVDLACCYVARCDERIRPCEPDWDRNSALVITCCCAGFRPSAVVRLWSDVVT
jgi:membrane protease YdiL (CAAX protease family)